MDTCIQALGEGWQQVHTIAYYSHLVPILLAVFLGTFALIKTRASKLSIIFASFTFAFSLWLIGDLVDWVSNNYYYIYFTWSWLDFINIVFFILGAFFFAVLAREKINAWEKVVMFLLCVPAFVITATGNSVLEFTHPVCEAVNNELLTHYKLAVEGIIVLYMLGVLCFSWPKTVARRFQLVSVLAAILLFFTVFAGTEYVASITGVYETNLYSLFVLPVFLIVMVFSVTNLGLFNLRLLGTQILSYVFILMSGVQLLFVQDSADITTSVMTVAISMILGLLLLQNAQKEEQARLKIEALAKQLDQANARQVTLIHFITHQVKGFVTKSRNIFAMIKEGDYGPVPDALTPLIEEGFRSDTQGVNTIQEILNAANIKSGKVNYSMKEFDLAELIGEIVRALKPNADAKGLTLSVTTESFTIMGDRAQLTNAFKNLIDNSIKYTPKGSVTITLSKKDRKAIFTVQDTGVGITAEDMPTLFTEGGHGKESAKVNVESTGFGLYIVKNIIDAHMGKVWVESDGGGKGSRFIVELPA